MTIVPLLLLRLLFLNVVTHAAGGRVGHGPGRAQKLKDVKFSSKIQNCDAHSAEGLYYAV